MPRFFVQKFCAAGVKRGGRIRGKRSARRSAKMPFVCKIGAFRARILHFVQQNQQNMPKLFPNRGGYGIINAVQVRTLSGGRAGLSCAPSEKRGSFFVSEKMPYPPALPFFIGAAAVFWCNLRKKFVSMRQSHCIFFHLVVQCNKIGLGNGRREFIWREK